MRSTIPTTMAAILLTYLMAALIIVAKSIQ